MTIFYTEQEDRWAEENRRKKAALEGAIDLVLCSDGNYRERGEASAFEAQGYPYPVRRIGF